MTTLRSERLKRAAELLEEHAYIIKGGSDDPDDDIAMKNTAKESLSLALLFRGIIKIRKSK